MGNAPVKIGIRLENTAEAGSVMKGRVFLSVKRVGERANGLHLSLKAEEVAEVVTCEENGNGQRKKLVDRASTIIFQMEVPLKTFQSRIVARGQYEYPFEWPLPNDLPSNMICRRGDSFCEVKYKLTAFLEKNGLSNVTTDDSCTIDVAISATSNMEHQGPVRVDCKDNIIQSCFPNQGSIRLGFDVDTAITAPQGNINVGIIGENDSRVSLQYLTARVIETTSWTAAGRKIFSSRVLCATNIFTLGLPNWNKTKSRRVLCRSRHQSRSFENDELEMRNNRVVAQLLLPVDALDSYQGSLVSVDHMLVVEAVTPRSSCATVPESSVKIDIQRRMPTLAPVMVSPTAPHAFLDITERDVQQTSMIFPSEPPMAIAELLPDDWEAQESEVFIVSTEETATASLPSAPQETLLQRSHQTTTSLRSLQDFLHKSENTTLVLQEELKKPHVVDVIRNMSPLELVETLIGSCRLEEHYPIHARMLACAMIPNFYCRHVLVFLCKLPRNVRFQVIKEVAPLAADIQQQREVVERELSSFECDQLRLALA